MGQIQDWPSERARGRLQAITQRDYCTMALNRRHNDTLPPIHHKSGSPSELTSLPDTLFSGKQQSIRSREDTSDQSEQSSIGYSSYAPSRHTGIAKSVVTERDSDEWHSESEANWTTIDPLCKSIPNDDALEDEGEAVDADECKDKQTMEIMRNESTRQNSPHLFEPPRSSKIFDPNSWSRLCLAQHNSFIPESKFYHFTLQ